MENTAYGSRAISNTNRGDLNTAVGRDALGVNQTGSYNTAVGARALRDNEEGFGNIAVGFEALTEHFEGDANIAIGIAALVENSGNNNIAIGWRAGFGDSGDNNIYLGNQPFPATVPNESRVMRLGSFEQSTFIQRTFIAGIFPVPVSGPVVRINSAGQLGIRVSSARYKRDIQPMGAHSRGLFQLCPVTFRYKQDVQGERQYGLIAEEVAKVYPELVTRGANGKVEAVRYEDLIPMLLNELQHQQRQLGAQAQQLSVLTAENERLQAMVVQQQERDAAVAARLERLEAAAARAAALASR